MAGGNLDPQALSMMEVYVGGEWYGTPTVFDNDLKEFRATNAEMAGYPWDAAQHKYNRVFGDYFIHYGAWGTKLSERTGLYNAINFKRL